MNTNINKKPKKRLVFEKIDWDYSKHTDLWQVTTEYLEEDSKEKLGAEIADKISKLVNKSTEIIK